MKKMGDNGASLWSVDPVNSIRYSLTLQLNHAKVDTAAVENDIEKVAKFTKKQFSELGVDFSKKRSRQEYDEAELPVEFVEAQAKRFKADSEEAGYVEGEDAEEQAEATDDTVSNVRSALAGTKLTNGSSEIEGEIAMRDYFKGTGRRLDEGIAHASSTTSAIVGAPQQRTTRSRASATIATNSKQPPCEDVNSPGASK